MLARLSGHDGLRGVLTHRCADVHRVNLVQHGLHVGVPLAADGFSFLYCFLFVHIDTVDDLRTRLGHVTVYMCAGDATAADDCDPNFVHREMPPV